MKTRASMSGTAATRNKKVYEKPKITTNPPDKNQAVPELSDVLTYTDPRTKAITTYKRGKFLGKGGFAKCYELTDIATNEVFAGKIVPKSLLQKSHQRDKMAQE